MHKALDSIPTQYGVNLSMAAILVTPAAKRLKQGIGSPDSCLATYQAEGWFLRSHLQNKK